MKLKKIEIPTNPLPAMWEHVYVVVTDAGVQPELNAMGKEGWELVTATRHNAIYSLFFKRKK